MTEHRKNAAESWLDRSPYDRCITRGMPGSMMPGFYNHNYQILQTPGYVVILVEMIHDARIIPVDGRPHLNADSAAVAGRLAWALGGQHPCRGDNELERQGASRGGQEPDTAGT